MNISASSWKYLPNSWNSITGPTQSGNLPSVALLPIPRTNRQDLVECVCDMFNEGRMPIYKRVRKFLEQASAAEPTKRAAANGWDKLTGPQASRLHREPRSRTGAHRLPYPGNISMTRLNSQEGDPVPALQPAQRIKERGQGPLPDCSTAARLLLPHAHAPPGNTPRCGVASETLAVQSARSMIYKHFAPTELREHGPA